MHNKNILFLYQLHSLLILSMMKFENDDWFNWAVFVELCVK